MSYAVRSEAVLVLAEAVSTNDEAFKYLEGRDHVLVWTTHQTRGRGSRGRSWLSPEGTGLALSLGLRCPPFPHPASCCYPLFAAVWVHEALSQQFPDAQFQLKWPNDVLLDGRKLAGILCESRLVGREASVVIGVGINLRDHYTLATLDRPYAALDELPFACDPAQLVERLRSAAPLQLDRLERGGHVQSWLRRCGLKIGQALRLVQDGTASEGRFDGLSPSGELRLLSADGSLHLISQAVEDCLILSSPQDAVQGPA